VNTKEQRVLANWIKEWLKKLDLIDENLFKQPPLRKAADLVQKTSSRSLVDLKKKIRIRLGITPIMTVEDLDWPSDYEAVWDYSQVREDESDYSFRYLTFTVQAACESLRKQIKTLFLEERKASSSVKDALSTHLCLTSSDFECYLTQQINKRPAEFPENCIDAIINEV